MFSSTRDWMKSNPVFAFFALTFLVSWSIWLPLGIYLPEQAALSLPGAWAPTISAVLLTGLSEGWVSVKRFLRKVGHWRVRFRWYLAVLFGIAVIAYLAIALGMLFGISAPEITLPGGLPREVLIGFLPI